MADLLKLKQSLEGLGYEVFLFDNKEEVKLYFSQEYEGKSMGIGGSMTVKELGLYPVLQEKNQVIWAWEGGDCKEATRCQVYLTSVNGVSETGEMINIDGLGNRVSASVYGTDEVVFLIGQNKVEASYEKALWRARNIAAPKNAQRLNKSTPCAKNADKCYNCMCSDRICRSMLVHLFPPSGSLSKVILVKEDLGY